MVSLVLFKYGSATESTENPDTLLSCHQCFYIAVMSSMFLHCCHVINVSTLLSCHQCFYIAVMSSMFLHCCHVINVSTLLSCHQCFLAIRKCDIQHFCMLICLCSVLVLNFSDHMYSVSVCLHAFHGFGDYVRRV